MTRTRWEYCDMAVPESLSSEAAYREFSVETEAQSSRLPREQVPQSIAALGQEGWELVAVTQTSEYALLYTFKRPISD